MQRSRSLADPTLPRKGPRQGNAAQRQMVDGPTQGRLVDYGGGKIVLTDMRGNLWPAERVRTLSGSFGFSVEGAAKNPRAWKFTPDGTPLVEGDWFLVIFLDNDAHKPCIIGGVRSLKPDDPDFFPPQPIGQDPNPLRLRAAVQDPNTGAITGTLQMTALDGGTNFEIVVGGAAFGSGVRILLDFGAGQIKVGAGAEIHPVMLGDEVVTRIQQIAQDLISLNAALPTLTPLATLNAFTILTDAITSLAAGAPMLSTIVKVQ